jgi:hypothetical protein
MAGRRIGRMLKTPIWLVILLAMLGGGAYAGYYLVIHGERPIVPDPCVTVRLTELHPDNVVVRVYNGGSIRGLAAEISRELKGYGFIVTTVANADEAIHDTIIVGSSVESPEVQFVLQFFAKATVRADDRIDHTVDVLVGDAGGAMVEDPPLSYTVPSGQACVPPRATPTPTPTPTETPEPEGEGG